MQLLTASEAAVMLSVSEGIARKILKDAPCVDYGRGRGRGKRWLKEDIEAVIKKNTWRKRDITYHTCILSIRAETV